MEDSTNKTHKYDRNVIRHDIIPRLKEQNARAVDRICETAGILTDEDRVLDQIAHKEFGMTCRVGKDEIKIAVPLFELLEAAIKRRVLRIAYKELTGSTEDLLFDHVEHIIHIASSKDKKGRYSLPGGLMFLRDENVAHITKIVTKTLQNAKSTRLFKHKG